MLRRQGIIIEREAVSPVQHHGCAVLLILRTALRKAVLGMGIASRGGVSSTWKMVMDAAA